MLPTETRLHVAGWFGREDSFSLFLGGFVLDGIGRALKRRGVGSAETYTRKKVIEPVT
jgi:hypothetical protein